MFPFHTHSIVIRVLAFVKVCPTPFQGPCGPIGLSGPISGPINGPTRRCSGIPNGLSGPHMAPFRPFPALSGPIWPYLALSGPICSYLAQLQPNVRPYPWPNARPNVRPNMWSDAQIHSYLILWCPMWPNVAQRVAQYET